MIRLIAAGSRTITDEHYVHEYLSKICKGHPIECVISGMARGVDMFAYNWGKKNNIPVVECPADWNQFGKRAGYIRNSEMANNYGATHLICFNDYRETEGTKGSSMMINVATKAGLKVKEVKYYGSLQVMK